VKASSILVQKEAENKYHRGRFCFDKKKYVRPKDEKNFDAFGRKTFAGQFPYSTKCFDNC